MPRAPCRKGERLCRVLLPGTLVLMVRGCLFDRSDPIFQRLFDSGCDRRYPVRRLQFEGFFSCATQASHCWPSSNAKQSFSSNRLHL